MKLSVQLAQGMLRRYDPCTHPATVVEALRLIGDCVSGGDDPDDLQVVSCCRCLLLLPVVAACCCCLLLLLLLLLLFCCCRDCVFLCSRCDGSETLTPSSPFFLPPQQGGGRRAVSCPLRRRFRPWMSRRRAACCLGHRGRPCSGERLGNGGSGPACEVPRTAPPPASLHLPSLH